MGTSLVKTVVAEFIVSGKKTVELRKWNTRFRGEFLVHASLNTKTEWMTKQGSEDLPRGCIVGKATLVDVKKYENHGELAADADKHFAGKEWWAEPTYGFILKNAERMEPIALKDKLNFFEVKNTGQKQLNELK